jgi:hypothetical protein
MRLAAAAAVLALAPMAPARRPCPAVPEDDPAPQPDGRGGMKLFMRGLMSEMEPALRRNG